MDEAIQLYFDQLSSKDKNIRYEGYQSILAATDEKVDWAYEVWNQLKGDLTDKDNHRRSMAVQFLCNLAKSDPKKRIIDDFHHIWKVTKDEKFVTARHSLQSVWKIGLVGDEQKAIVVDHLKERYLHCTEEKNYTLTRFDIIQSLRYLYDEINDEDVKQLSLDLIEKEEDPKYKKKFASVWKNRKK